MNTFKLFKNKISELPLFIKQLIIDRLYFDMRDFGCSDILNDGKNFSAYIPTLTFKGETELNNKELGFDSNVYGFLNYVKSGCSIAEISLNAFYTMEEVSKYFELCINQGLVNAFEYENLMALLEYLSGKTRLGEYLVAIGKITEKQLHNIENSIIDGKKFGEMLVDSGLVVYSDLKAVLKLKEESKKRFVLNYNDVPNSNGTEIYKDIADSDEISRLKSENKRLKAQLIKLSQLVK